MWAGSGIIHFDHIIKRVFHQQCQKYETLCKGFQQSRVLQHCPVIFPICCYCPTIIYCRAFEGTSIWCLLGISTPRKQERHRSPRAFRQIKRMYCVCKNSWLLLVKKKKAKEKTYNSWDSLVVTHPTTNQPIWSLCMAERTGCPVIFILWSYVSEDCSITIYTWFYLCGIRVMLWRWNDIGGIWPLARQETQDNRCHKRNCYKEDKSFMQGSSMMSIRMLGYTKSSKNASSTQVPKTFG